jgi:hypothetical protein
MDRRETLFPPSTSLRVTERPRAKHSNSAATQSGLSDAVGRAFLSIEARYRHLWQKPGFSVMRDRNYSATAGRSGAMLSSVCGRMQLFIVLIVGGLTIATGETPNASV